MVLIIILINKLGDVIERNIKNTTQKNILSSHHEGKVLGLEYVPDRYVSIIINIWIII